MVAPVSDRTSKRTMGLAKVLARRKTVVEEEGDQGGTKLKRVLGLADLTLLGVGSTLGLGVYVLAGSVARTDAGPAVTLSFLIAAVASAFAGFCYAEFAARVPKAGSAYVYSYVTVGELAAFIIGWNLILEYVIGTASVARGLSNYLDSLTGRAMSSALTQVMPIRVSWLSPYPDFLSCGFVLVLSVLVAWGVRESSLLNNVFTAVNLLTVVIVVVIGSFYIDTNNWSIDKAAIPAVDAHGQEVKPGSGGFMPFGFSGVMAGAAKCFYGFVGFDCVATTGEEAKRPKRDIPLSIILSLLIIFLAYFSTAAVLTLMWPYYLQDVDTPLPYVFGQVGLPVLEGLVTIGAVFALCTNMMGCLFPIPRMLYSMANDGLLFLPLARLNPVTQTPVLASMLGGGIAGIMATIFNLDQLIDMMSIGTLLAYTIVAICVLVLRYKDPEPRSYESPAVDGSGGEAGKSSIQKTIMAGIFNLSMRKYPDKTSENVSRWAITFFVVLAVVFCVGLSCVEDQLAEGGGWAVALVAVLVAVLLVTVFVLQRQPQAPASLTFQVPFVPLLPCLSICINGYLMVKLDMHTWIRFSVWLFIGMLIYVFYSIPNSVEGLKSRVKEDVANQEKIAAPSVKTVHT